MKKSKTRRRRPGRGDTSNSASTRRRGWALVKAATRSGLRRYPQALISSLRRAPAVETGRKIASCEHIEEHSLAAAWLGHATVLARLGQANILVDPVFSDRVGMRLGKATMGPRRLDPLAVMPQGLPPVHILLITHAHFDHLDRPTLRQLASPRTTVVTAARTRRLIPRGFGAVIELAAGQAATIGGVRIAAIRTVHWGARRLIDWRRGHNSYLVESAARSVLFAGDTALTDAFVDLGPIDLAVLGIGCYDPWEQMHATPEQVWSMFCGMGAKRLLPVHHSTFRLGDEPVDEPMQRLLLAADGRANEIVRLYPGELWIGPMPVTPPLENAS